MKGVLDKSFPQTWLLLVLARPPARCFDRYIPNLKCIFPFFYNGKNKTTCTWDSSELTNKKPWCSTLVDETGNHVGGQGEWGNCGPGCPIPPENRTWIMQNQLLIWLWREDFDFSLKFWAKNEFEGIYELNCSFLFFSLSQVTCIFLNIITEISPIKKCLVWFLKWRCKL